MARLSSMGELTASLAHQLNPPLTDVQQRRSGPAVHRHGSRDD
jgi:hypothetical protein